MLRMLGWAGLGDLNRAHLGPGALQVLPRLGEPIEERVAKPTLPECGPLPTFTFRHRDFGALWELLGFRYTITEIIEVVGSARHLTCIPRKSIWFISFPLRARLVSRVAEISAGPHSAFQGRS